MRSHKLSLNGTALHWAWRVLPAVLLLAGLVLAVVLPPPGSGARAEVLRMFPHDVERAKIAFGPERQVRVDGKVERLGPGTQVRDEHNRIPQLRRLQGQTVDANYQRDAAGNIFRIWILTPAEIAQHSRKSRNKQRWAPVSGDLPQGQYLN